MKNNIILFAALLAVSATAHAQDDDMYFASSPKKSKTVTLYKMEPVGQAQMVTSSDGRTIDIDEYNRRGGYGSSFSSSANDVYVVDDTKNEQLAYSAGFKQGYNQGYSNGFNDGDDMSFTYRINRWRYPWHYSCWDPWYTPGWSISIGSWGWGVYVGTPVYYDHWYRPYRYSYWHRPVYYSYHHSHYFDHWRHYRTPVYRSVGYRHDRVNGSYVSRPTHSGGRYGVSTGSRYPSTNRPSTGSYSVNRNSSNRYSSNRPSAGNYGNRTSQSDNNYNTNRRSRSDNNYNSSRPSQSGNSYNSNRSSQSGNSYNSNRPSYSGSSTRSSGSFGGGHSSGSFGGGHSGGHGGGRHGMGGRR